MKDQKQIKQNELEFLSLYHFFKQKIEEGTIRNDKNARQFIRLLESMVSTLNNIILLRKETAALENIRVMNEGEASGNCPVCKSNVPVDITGETKSPSGYTVNILKCTICDTVFDDILPNGDEELINWYETVMAQLSISTTNESGLPNRIPTDELDSIREIYEDLKKSRESVLAARRQLVEIEETSEKQLLEVTKYLYGIYGQTISSIDQTALN